MAIFSHGTNPYFDSFNNQGEQDLIEDLIIEAVSIYGQDMFYLPRTLGNYDPIMGEDASSKYTQAVPMAMYVRSVDGFEGDGTFMSKFGLEIRDQVTFTFSKRIWEEEVGSATGQERPHEGDLIWFPLNQKLFQIMFVNYKPFFYQFGILPTWDITCELYQYSNEVLDTGVPEIDQVQVQYTTNILESTILDEEGIPILAEDGNYIVNETYAEQVPGGVSDQGPPIQEEQESNNVINWTEIDPFSDTGHY